MISATNYSTISIQTLLQNSEKHMLDKIDIYHQISSLSVIKRTANLHEQSSTGQYWSSVLMLKLSLNENT